MNWLPRVGEPLPRASEVTGVRRKLATYCLDPENEVGRPKALGFESILGITAAAVDYLEAAIRSGVLSAPVVAVRENPPHGVNCVVELPIDGIGAKRGRTVGVRTIWRSRKSKHRPGW